MAERGSYAQGPRLDIQQLLVEAQHRWLRPAEICEILSNYHKFQISSEPPNRPPSGSLFLFDRKVLRYFRKDGHNWRKKKDGKTVKEAHEKLKVGSVDVLHCYYAHGEENETFQRRCYWMLEQDLMHIVFVHYLEVKGNRANVGREIDEVTTNLQKGSHWNSSPSSSNCRTPSGYTDYTSPSSTHASSCEDADSGDSHQASSLLRSVFESPQMGNGPLMDKKDVDLSLHPCTNNQDGQSSIHGTYYKPHFEKDQPHYSDDSGYVIDSQKTLGVGSWEEILEQCTTGYHTVTSHASMSSIQPTSTGFPLERQNITPAEHLAGDRTLKQEFGSSLPIQENWQIPLEDNSQLPKCSPDQSMNLQLPCNLDAKLFEQRINDVNLRNAPELITNPNQRNEQLVQNNYQTQLTNAESQCLIVSNSEHDIPKDGNINYALTLRQQLLDREEGLKKVDSFSRWVSKELGEVDDLQMQSSSGISWSTVDCENVVNDSSLSPSISQDQLFSIVDFSPKWAYTDSEIEVRVIGAFLISQQDVVKYNWSCMFGEVEVPAEVIADGVLSCCAPPHGVGQVPFYVTCSNRLACSEVREFDYHDYQISSPKGLDMTDNSATDEMHLHLRLEKLLSLTSVSPQGQLFEGVKEKQNLISKIISLKEDEEYSHVPMPVNDLLQHDGMEHLIKMMKEKLYTWLLHKAIEDGKGPSVLDDEGQGVLHLAAALGYDWAIIPIETAGVSINFRDVNGWTALHWAAFYGREQTVAVLLSLGAAPGALTDPSPEYPLGRTPADLASVNRHKGISGFLAEASLTSYLDSLTMNDAKEDGAVEISGTRAVKTFSERTATPVNYGDMPEALSLKDSLTAVTNATQAAVRIHQMFRMQSFERRKLTESDDDDEFGMLDEQAISLIASKSRKAGSIKGLANTAAIQIQKKFRGWKKRKEFLQIRQRIVKIQAHVRGHQVRKQYKAITWSVGILEKVILRWRRKGTGLRGFRPDAVAKDPNPQVVPSEEDDYDFLKKGRKQTEERLQKALTRVKSMVQYPEGRAQYRRLLNVVEGFRETKASDSTMDGSEYKAEGGEDLIDIDKLLDDDTFMSIAFD